MKRALLLPLLYLAIAPQAVAENPIAMDEAVTDTLMTPLYLAPRLPLKAVKSNSLYHRLRDDIDCASLPGTTFMIIRSALGVPMTTHHRSLQPGTTEHNTVFEDYGRFAPGLLLYGMKACGVESATPWSEMLTAHAISGVITVGATYLLKNTIHEVRPHRTDSKSFSSGHSAIAFMMATMLDKEYGNLSPFFKYGGYAVATGVSYSLYRRKIHWTHDVIGGAAIGYLSTQLGYALKNQLFHRPYEEKRRFPYLYAVNALRVSVNSGMVSTYHTHTFRNNDLYSLGTGYNLSLEVRKEMGTLVGLGGELSYKTLPYRINGQVQESTLKGLYGSLKPVLILPLDRRFSMELTGRVGINRYFKSHPDALHTLGSTTACHYGAGLSLKWHPDYHKSYGIVVDYTNEGPYTEGASRFRTLGIGAGISLTF
jgi:membrane-associated phospholipid phosphatase